MAHPNQIKAQTAWEEINALPADALTAKRVELVTSIRTTKTNGFDRFIAASQLAHVNARLSGSK